MVALFNRFLLALTLSLLIGGIFWQVRAGREQEYVWDRLGFLSTMLGVGVLPLLLGDLWNGKGNWVIGIGILLVWDKFCR